MRKGARISPATGLGKEIEEFFDRQIIEQQFLQEEKDIIKTMVLEVAETITSNHPTPADLRRTSAHV